VIIRLLTEKLPYSQICGKKWVRPKKRRHCPANLLDCIYAFRSVKRANQIQPIIVHCSAGVGRSATFIALDIQLQKLAKEEKIDVLESFHRYVKF